MKKHCIAVTATSFLRNPGLLSGLHRATSGHQILIPSQDIAADDVNSLAEFCRPATIALIGREIFNSQLLDRLPQLQAVAKYGVGLDNIDLEAMEQRGISLLHSRGVNAFPVAEHALGMMLMVTRRLFHSAVKMRQGIWDKNGGSSLSELVVGIVGCGAVGQQMGNLLRTLGSQVLVCDIEDRRTHAAKWGGQQVSYEELLAQVDLVSFHVPLTPATKNMFNLSAITHITKSIAVINTSRGEVIDESALLYGLDTGKITAAALDVFWGEPSPDQRLLSHPAVIATPHTAGNSKSAVISMGNAAIENIAKFLASIGDI